MPGLVPRAPQAPVDPSTFPEYYALAVDGDDMLPFVPDDATLALAKSAVLCAGNVVLLWRRPECIAADAHQAQVGLLAAALPPFLTLPWVPSNGCGIEPAIIVERTNPPRRFIVGASTVLAIHKAIGLFPGPSTPGGSHPYDTLIPFAAVLS
jgi:hypothetical protein